MLQWHSCCFLVCLFACVGHGDVSLKMFYGKGRVKGGDGMYDMQSQMFDQQIHSWRFTGNRTHEPLLRKALKLHVEWAEDCFDADGNGLYHSYINTWPTASVSILYGILMGIRFSPVETKCPRIR